MNLVKMLYSHMGDINKKPFSEPAKPNILKEIGEGDNFHLAPSYLTKCAKQIYFRKIGTKSTNPISEASLFKMEMGKVIHRYLEKLLEELDILESAEIERNINLRGVKFKYYYDGLLIDRKTEKRYMYELKTVYATGFKAIENTGPRVDNVLQLLFYMYAEKIQDGILLYGGRDNGFLRQFNLRLIKKDDRSILLIDDKETDYVELFNEKLDRMELIAEAIRSRKEPETTNDIAMKKWKGEVVFSFTKDKEKIKSDWECTYCQFHDLCHAQKIKNFIKSDDQFYIKGKTSE